MCATVANEQSERCKDTASILDDLFGKNVLDLNVQLLKKTTEESLDDRCVCIKSLSVAY